MAAVGATQRDMCALNFHVTDATRLLASVEELSEASNDVVFSHGPRGSYIRNRRTGEKTAMQREIGVCVLEVMVLNGEVATPMKIIIDSGAAENVMPKNDLRGVEMKEKERGARFMAASGEEMSNYSPKDQSFMLRHSW